MYRKTKSNWPKIGSEQSSNVMSAISLSTNMQSGLSSLTSFHKLNPTFIYSTILITVIVGGMRTTRRGLLQFLKIFLGDFWCQMRKLSPHLLLMYGINKSVPAGVQQLMRKKVQYVYKSLLKRLKLWVKKNPKAKHSLHNQRKVNKTVTLYRKMPLKVISRLWGRFNDIHLPVFLRHPLLSIYVWMFGCNLSEAEIEDLKHYRNLGEFFRRRLKPNVRPIDEVHVLTSPADGKILHHGKVENGLVEQVKGVTYSLRGFLGPAWQRNRHGEDINHLSDEEYQNRLGVKPGHNLYHTIIYLAPGDYHRFHAPTKWNVQHRRHFPGELLSVSPGVARWVKGLFNFNERVVYSGTWEHGFFSMTAVGATNVGSIKIYCDEELTTNNSRKHPHGTYFDKSFSSPIPFDKGEMFGEFNLGSTIVLIFEAPNDFDFKIENSKKIKFGEAVGTYQADADGGK
ncbi:phosphatidylserine decarboxylase proenzyme, mitochondrial-like isoform X2 [Haliotis asinina]|uniref:phosphatidylserine decarboxylase proenzyme, mitochondrial-like isoform X2 n=1 Tax=Haliotis asinina TaxID=109174 RepID=UPI003531F835